MQKADKMEQNFSESLQLQSSPFLNGQDESMTSEQMSKSGSVITNQ